MTFTLGIVVDQNQALRFALDIARGMEFLHTMEPLIPNLTLSSKHVMVCVSLLFFHNSTEILFPVLSFVNMIIHQSFSFKVNYFQ